MATGSGSSPAAGGPRTGPPAAPVPGPAQPMVAVWEWQDDAGCWRPYSGQVCRFIEQSLSHQRGWRGPGPSAGGSVSLGQADPSLAAYIIDIPSLKQFRQDTGKLRSVRQSLFPQSSALASGVFWEWASDEGGWTPYETRTSILLEHSYQARQATADLGPHGYNYIVDLTALLQVNKTSGFRRQVRRQASAPYPLASGPACTCQQCLSHGGGGGGGGGAGPVSSRSRHSFSAGQAARPALQPHGRGAPTLAYSPYSRRPLSMGHMSWGGPWNPATSAPAVGAGPAPSAAPSANGLSVPAVPLHLNGSSGVTSALAGMASILMSAAGLGVRFVSAGGPPRGRHGDVRRAKRPHRTGSHKSENVIQKYMEEVPAPPEEVPGERSPLALVFFTTVVPSSPKALLSSPSGLHHMHGAPGLPVRLRGGVGRGGVHPAQRRGEADQVWPHPPHALHAGHVQQWNQGWEPSVSFLQDNLRGEDRDAAQGQDGDLQHFPVPPRPLGLRHHSDRLQHSAGHPGSRAPQPRPAVHLPRVPALLLPARQREGEEGAGAAEGRLDAEAHLHRGHVQHHRRAGHGGVERDPPQDGDDVQRLRPRLPRPQLPGQRAGGAGGAGRG
uniref:E3 ubiquitin-protein ligase n=1 Tax=Denticeps clupeoides TaxID=299321 RepID=A0AAY4DE85_9TELE